jgi:hypothetical protein
MDELGLRSQLYLKQIVVIAFANRDPGVNAKRVQQRGKGVGMPDDENIPRASAQFRD